MDVVSIYSAYFTAFSECDDTHEEWREIFYRWYPDMTKLNKLAEIGKTA